MALAAWNNARPRNRIKLRDNAEHNLRTRALYYVPLRNNNTPVGALDGAAIHAQFLFGPRINVAREFLSDDNSTPVSVSHARFTVRLVNRVAKECAVPVIITLSNLYSAAGVVTRPANEPRG